MDSVEISTHFAAGESQTQEFKTSFDKACLASLVAFAGIRKSVWAPEDQVMTTFTRKIAKACCTSGSDGVEFNCRES